MYVWRKHLAIHSQMNKPSVAVGCRYIFIERCRCELLEHARFFSALDAPEKSHFLERARGICKTALLARDGGGGKSRRASVINRHSRWNSAKSTRSGPKKKTRRYNWLSCSVRCVSMRERGWILCEYRRKW